MRMQVILDSSFVRPGSAPIWGGKKGEFRDWTSLCYAAINVKPVEGGGGGVIGRGFDRSLWPGGRAFELSCCPGGWNI